MKAVGLDLGGTKIEAQVFDDDWQVGQRERVATPKGYDDLVEAVAGLIARTERGDVPVGIAAAGLVNPSTGLAYTANLPATDRTFPADIAAALGRDVSYVNDCRAMTLSEAIFGAARGRSPVVGLILGTGVGGGIAVDGRLLESPAGVGGEFGHMAAPAHIVAAHNLPVVRCGCGRIGCIETYLAGPGLTRLAEHFLGQSLEPRKLADAPDAGQVWEVWTDFASELLMTLTMTVDPDCVVLGGGLSLIDGVAPRLQEALQRKQFRGFGVPEVLLAEGGDTSGARGAAFAAWSAREGRG